jgi:hypothetical protein
MAIDPILIERLLAEAKAHNAAGDNHAALAAGEYALAKNIQRAVELLQPTPQSGGMDARPVTASKDVPPKVPRTGKGKPPGAMSQRWRGHFAEIIRIVPPPHLFGFNHVQDVVKRREGRDMRDSEIRRLFEGNVKQHGYLVQPSRDLYQPTQKLIDLIGLKKHEGPPASTEGPNAGGVAERFNAPDYESGEVQGSSLTSNGPQASVSSNLTASAPANADIFSGISLAPPNPSTPTND